MSKYDKYIGQVYGRLKLIKFVGKTHNNIPLFECKCSCGNTITVKLYSLRSGNTKSCGCYRSEYTANKNIKHGLSNCELYSIWKAIRQRCYNPKCKDYKYYGAVGVKLSDEWDKDFHKFYTDMYQEYCNHISKYGNKNTSLDRINPNGNYCKENCHWVTWAEQNSSAHKRVFKGNTEVIGRGNDLSTP